MADRTVGIYRYDLLPQIAKDKAKGKLTFEDMPAPAQAAFAGKDIQALVGDAGDVTILAPTGDVADSLRLIAAEQAKGNNPN